jgi:hypothetical protein
MSESKTLIIPFLLGGTIISSVKFAATNLNNPALSAIIGGLPIGLLSIYFLSSEKSIDYAQNYFYVTLALSSAIIIFYSIHVHTNLHKNSVLLIAIFAWIILVLIRYKISQYKK